MFEKLLVVALVILAMQEEVEWSLCLHQADKATSAHQLPLKYVDSDRCNE